MSDLPPSRRDERAETMIDEFRSLVAEAYRIGGLGWAPLGSTMDEFNRRSGEYQARLKSLSQQLDEAKAAKTADDDMPSDDDLAEAGICPECRSAFCEHAFPDDETSE